MVLSTEDVANKFNLPVFGRILSYAVSAVDPNYFGIAPIPAVKMH